MEKYSSTSFHLIVSREGNGDYRLYCKDANAEYHVSPEQVEKEIASLAKFWWVAQENQT